MQLSSWRNNQLVERKHGPASVQHADPLRSASRGRDEPCARGHSRPERESIRAADPAGPYFCRPHLCPPHKEHWKFFGYIRKLSNPKRKIAVVWAEGAHDHGLSNLMSHLVGMRVYESYTCEYRGLRHIAILFARR